MPSSLVLTNKCLRNFIFIYFIYLVLVYIKNHAMIEPQLSHGGLQASFQVP